MNDYTTGVPDTQPETELLGKKVIPKKYASLELADSFERLARMTHDPWFQKRAQRVRDCTRFLTLAVPAIFGDSRSGDQHKARVASASFCRKRLCPQCDWRRSLNIAAQVSQILAAITVEKPTTRYIFLTLTIKNVPGEKFAQSIDILQQGFRRLLKRYKKRLYCVLGGFRSLEVTINPDTKEYHPHIHAVFAVAPKYFADGYISKDEWAKMWKDVIDLDYIPSVDIRVVTEDEPGAHSFAGSAAEIAKYAAKSTDYLLPSQHSETDSRVAVLSQGLHHRRLVNMWGIIKQYHHDLNLCDPESIPDVLPPDGLVVRDDVLYFLVGYRWGENGFDEVMRTQKAYTWEQIKKHAKMGKILK